MGGKLINEKNASCLRYIIPSDWSKAEKNAKPIFAENVIEAIISGKNVEIINAVIEGDFKLKYVNVEGEIAIQRTEIRGIVDWSYSTFKRVLNLEKSIFKTEATFTGITIEKDIFLDNANFFGRAEISDGMFTGVLHCRSTTFKDAMFCDSIFKKRIEFSKSTFEGEANFECAQICGEAKFEKAEFKQNANFNGAQIEGSAYFNQVTFKGEADFTGVGFGNSVEVDNATFKELAKFNSAKIEKYARFFSVFFKGEADFTSVRIDSVAVFKQSKFKQNSSFNRAQIGESAMFNQAIFEKKADFVGIRIGSNADFENATFKELAKFARARIEGHALFDSAFFEGEADFTNARIGSNADFEKAEFKEKVRFDSAQIEGSTIMKTFFDDKVSFQNVSFKAIFFGENEEIQVQLKGKIDLHGCTYDRIHPISIWRPLMNRLDLYDRQPFTQLEKTFRQAGKNDLADDVYLEGRYREFSEIRKFTLQWFKNGFLQVFTGYGVRIKRLLFLIVPIILLGTGFYHYYPEAVILKSNINLTTLPKPQDSPLESFWVCLNLFLPVEIPSGAYWDPAPNVPTIVGTLLKLAGWILVPIGVAGISGLLKRKSEN